MASTPVPAAWLDGARKNRSETEIVQAILQYLASRRIWAARINSGAFTNPAGAVFRFNSRRGMPDIIGCAEGRFLALEVKRLGARPRGPKDARRWAEQERTLAEVRHAGGIAARVSSIEETVALLAAAGVS